MQTACNVTSRGIGKAYRQMNAAEKKLADSILLYSLDHEALYTLCDTLKPMSSVKFYQLPVFSAIKEQKDSAIKAISQIQSVVNRLSLGDYQFVLNPFARRDSIYRNMEIYVFRKSRLQSIIRRQQDFYSQFGITENTMPATVLAVTEYENKYDRWRSYGYLFGYPDYAVDFFVDAGKSQDSTKEFVKRDFFQVPVYVGTQGHFTYAVPKGYSPVAADSALLNQAVKTLEKYKVIRKRFETTSGIKAIKLWKNWNEK